MGSAGVVEEVGSEVTRWKKGDEVMALLGGGGYAQYVSVHSGHAMRIPKGYSMIQAAGVMETYMTTFQSLFWLGKISKGESVLIHGGASGIGTSAIQLAKSLPGVRVFATAGSDEKCKMCESLGAEKCINYKSTPDFVSEILLATKDEPGGAGVDFILDFVGQQYFNQNLNLLKTDGRLVYLAMLSGPIAEKVDMGPILRKRLSIQGTTLRSRSIEYKSRLVKDFEAYGTELLDEGILKPIIDKTFDWAEIAEAHNYMEQNMNSGKIILTGM
jgi:putative PIG3 family NAD(P)H quinone oxidoreductase